MKDEELEALGSERHQLASQLGFTSMEGHAGWVKRHGEVRELILAEEDRRAGLTGLPLAARQLQDSAAMVAANQRMAEASEAAAKAAAVAAEASKSAARWTLVAAVVAAGAVAIQAWQVWQATPAGPPPAAVDGGKKLGG